jgi:hypothetical protein
MEHREQLVSIFLTPPSYLGWLLCTEFSVSAEVTAICKNSRTSFKLRDVDCKIAWDPRPLIFYVATRNPKSFNEEASNYLQDLLSVASHPERFLWDLTQFYYWRLSCFSTWMTASNFANCCNYLCQCDDIKKIFPNVISLAKELHWRKQLMKLGMCSSKCP